VRAAAAMFKEDTGWSPSKALPVLFVVWVMVVVWSVYVRFHLLELFQVNIPLLGLRFDAARDHAMLARAHWHAAVSQFLTAMMLICFFRAMFTDPGSVPDSPEWRIDHAMEAALRLRRGRVEKVSSGHASPVRECKRSGEPRLCKWCDRLKPDRSHHCRVCKSCVLRMDHHCPLIANCVGQKNHKWFFLFVLYSLAACWFVQITMFESVAKAIGFGPVHVETGHRKRYALLFAATLAGLVSFLLTMFAGLHCYLIATGTTTIEHCEKHTGPPNTVISYSHGLWEDLAAVLGPYFLLWLVPVSPSVSDGLYFEVSDASKAVGEPLLAEHKQLHEAPAPSAKPDSPVTNGKDPPKSS